MEKIPLNEEWLLVESRTFASWDNAKYQKDAPENLPSSRIRIQHPPKFTIPTLPSVLPPKEGAQYVKHKPGAVEVCRAAVANTMISLDGVNIVANSAFLYALWGGHPGALKDRYLLQWSDDDILFVHLVPWSNRTDVSAPGFVAERMCCEGRHHEEWHFSLAKFKIGNYTLLIVSEVDGFNPETNSPIEMTVQKKPKPPSLKELLQVSLNGSTQYVQFKLSKDSTVLESLKVVQRDDLLVKNLTSWANAGRQIQSLLSLILRDTVVKACLLYTSDAADDLTRLDLGCAWLLNSNKLIQSVKQYRQKKKRRTNRDNLYNPGSCLEKGSL